MSDLLDRRGALTRILPAGPAQSDDAAVVTTGTVYSVDPTAKTVQVGVRDGTVTLPAVAGRYRSGGLARVLLDPIKTRPILVLGPVDPTDPVIVSGVTALGTGQIRVQYQDSEVVIPIAAGTYTAGQSAWVACDDWGTPVLALAASTTPAPGWHGVTAPHGGETVTATATIGPQDSGTWRSAYGRWDSWNSDRYGGPSDVYQGDAYGSGLLQGWAGYGEQVLNLGAVTIDEITLSACKTDVNGLSASLAVQGTAAGTRPGGAPSGAPFGTAATPSIGPGGWGELTLPDPLCEAFRTGAVKGLIAVGTDYGAFGGTATPGSFVLRIQYTKRS